MKQDVVILGGGLAGLTFARHLKQELPEIKITVIERQKHPVEHSAYKVGESSVEIGAHYFNHTLKLKEHLKKDQLKKFGLRCFMDHGNQLKIHERVEYGGTEYFNVPTFQIDRGILENYLAEELQRTGVTFIDNAQVKEVNLKERKTTYQINDQIENLESGWIIDATGRNSFLKKKLALAQENEHFIDSAWFRVNAKINIDDWNDSPEWKGHYQGEYSRWYSTNHLMGKGYWVWIIPLSTGVTSIGIVADSKIHPLNSYNKFEKALNWLEKFEPELYTHLAPHQDKILDFKLIKKFSYDCQKVFDGEDRFGLIGEAGAFLDPFYSPGSDFIAIGNTFLVDLIKRDCQKERIYARSIIYNDLYLSLFKHTLNVYQNMYPIFGNPTAMPVKIAWDYAVYWSFTASLFFHNKLTDIKFISENKDIFYKIGEINLKMQEHFINWDKSERSLKRRGYFDISKNPYYIKLNSALNNSFSPEEYQEHFKTNFSDLLKLKDEILEYSSYSRIDQNKISEKEFILKEQFLYS